MTAEVGMIIVEAEEEDEAEAEETARGPREGAAHPVTLRSEDAEIRDRGPDHKNSFVRKREAKSCGSFKRANERKRDRTWYV